MRSMSAADEPTSESRGAVAFDGDRGGHGQIHNRSKAYKRWAALVNEANRPSRYDFLAWEFCRTFGRERRAAVMVVIDGWIVDEMLYQPRFYSIQWHAYHGSVS